MSEQENKIDLFISDSFDICSTKKLNTKPTEENLCVLLMGDQGTGKTTIFNLLTGKNQIVRAGGDSATVEVLECPTKAGETCFTIVDTPGVGSDNIEHSIILKGAMTFKPINLIVICISFDRKDIVKNNFLKHYAKLEKYLDNVLVLITKLDHLDDELYKEIEQQPEIIEIKKEKKRFKEKRDNNNKSKLYEEGNIWEKK